MQIPLGPVVGDRVGSCRAGVPAVGRPAVGAVLLLAPVAVRLLLATDVPQDLVDPQRRGQHGVGTEAGSAASGGSGPPG